MRRGALACALALMTGGAQAAQAAPELPLGPRSLDERRSSAQLTPAVRWTRIVREGGPWRLNVLSIAPRPGSSFATCPARCWTEAGPAAALPIV